MPLRRYEILLPLHYNDGTPVEYQKFRFTRCELVDRFGATSVESAYVKGIWTHEGKVFEDNTFRWIVDVEDSQEIIAFFTEWKETLKERFQQLEIWITYYDIGRI